MRVKFALRSLKTHVCAIKKTMDRYKNTRKGKSYPLLRQTLDVHVGLKTAKWWQNKCMRYKTKR